VKAGMLKSIKRLLHLAPQKALFNGVCSLYRYGELETFLRDVLSS